MKSVLIAGCGDIGYRVAQRWLNKGAKVYGIRRELPDASNTESLVAKQVEHILIDLDVIDSKTRLPQSELVYYFTPPPNNGVTDPRIDYFLKLLEKNSLPDKIILISTSAVYGNCDGEWVTEKTQVNPLTERGKRRLYAEQQANKWCSTHGVKLVTLRVPGIYGPGRLPIERLRKKLPVLKQALAPYSNRIHSDDLAYVCVEVAEQKNITGIYNVTDGEPGNMTQYFMAVADACGLPRPQEVSMAEAKQQLSAGMLSYLSESRRISNQKLLDETGIVLQFPTLSAGLKSCGNIAQIE